MKSGGLFYNDFQSRKETEDFLNKHFEIVYSSEMKTRKTKGIGNVPIIYRYFLFFAFFP